jgi:toxin-antitoxin system PIN domain toxin
MNSLDTNILIYAINSDCPEHSAAWQVYEAMLQHPANWILSDQVLFEFYRALRNSKILQNPLNHQQALKQVEFLRNRSGIRPCAYNTGLWSDLINGFGQGNPKSTHIFDRVLAVTLRHHGVTTFYTRNTKDFEGFGFTVVINPIDVP